MMNNVNKRERECALKKLMAYDFMQLELNLYLDTHPCDQRALNEFHKVNKKAIELRKLFEERYGELTTSSAMSNEKWSWIESPWPWEN